MAKRIDFDDRTICNEYGSLYKKRNNELINSKEADINMIVGRRSNGKTYPTATFDGVKRFIDSNYTDAFAYVRRYDTDLKTMQVDLFKGCIGNGWLSWYTKGKWNDIYYYRGKWYLRRLNDDHEVEEKMKNPVAYAFAINRCEAYKGPDYLDIKMILFDEFIPMKAERGYIPGEWKLWQNLVSTIVRERGDVTIYMIANTISKNSIYFDKYKIDIDKIEQGSIVVYKFKSGGKMALEYCKDSDDVSIESSKYFEIDDSDANMITKGTWETADYPTLPKKYRKYKSRTHMSFFMHHGSKVIQGDILSTESGMSMIYFHLKTTPVRKKYDYEYFETWDIERMDEPNFRIGFNPQYQLDKIILTLIKNNQCYYQNPDVGETVKYFIENTK